LCEQFSLREAFVFFHHFCSSDLRLRNSLGLPSSRAVDKIVLVGHCTGDAQSCKLTARCVTEEKKTLTPKPHRQSTHQFYRNWKRLLRLKIVQFAWLSNLCRPLSIQSAWLSYIQCFNIWWSWRGLAVARWSRSTYVVALHRARLVLRWVTVCRRINRLGM